MKNFIKQTSKLSLLEVAHGITTRVMLYNKKYYSTHTSPLSPVKVYTNPDKEKQQIYSDNEGLTGVYL